MGIADLLKDGPRHYSDLAVACGGHPQALFRVPCGVASIGIITRLDDAHFALNQLIPTSLAFHLIEALAI